MDSEILVVTVGFLDGCRFEMSSRAGPVSKGKNVSQGGSKPAVEQLVQGLAGTKLAPSQDDGGEWRSFPRRTRTNLETLLENLGFLRIPTLLELGVVSNKGEVITYLGEVMAMVGAHKLLIIGSPVGEEH